MGKISFTNSSAIKFSFEKALLKSFFPVIFLEEGVEFNEINFIFCSDDYLLGLNKEFLNHDTYTDILTFTLSNGAEPIISEIYISIDRVKENSESLDIPFMHELNRVMIHGILHLCGYSDDEDLLKTEMTQREDYYLEKLGST